MDGMIGASPDSETSRDNRILAARLKLVVDSLTATVIFNPAGVLVVIAVMVVGKHALGPVPVESLYVAFAMQMAGALAAWIVQRLHADWAEHDLHRSLLTLVALQAMLAASWGVVGWLLWQNGNAANNIYIETVVLCVVWSITFARSMCRPVFLTGVIVVAGIFEIRFLTAGGTIADILAVITPLLILYTTMMGKAGSRRVDEALRARFDNEDLSKALQSAVVVALERRRDAEAANAAKTAFLANMSHELRTPLNAILGFSDIIAEQSLGSDPERYADYAQDIHAAGSHLLAIINDLLDVAKIESGKMEINALPIDPSEALSSVERLMAPKARAKRQRLTITFDKGSPWVIADERAFMQIALNLVSNAVKFTQDEGRVSVTGRRAEDGGFLLIVSDNGPGIDPAKLEKVFQPFTQVENRYDRNSGGTGLGLSLVQGLAKLHGGRAWIESEPGRGTTVFVYLPLAIDASLHAFQAFG